MAKDKRKKGCTNPNCERHINKFFYDHSEEFCSKCGSELVYVCVECFKKLDENGDIKQKVCDRCLIEKEGKGKLKYNVDKFAKKAGADLQNAGVAIVEGAEKGIDAIKEQTPVIMEQVQEIAKQEKVRNAVKGAAIAAVDIGKDAIKNPKVRKIVTSAVKELKK